MAEEKRVDYSLEVAHIYVSEFSDEMLYHTRAEVSQWAKPLHAQLSDSGSVETVLLIDDYFAPEGEDTDRVATSLKTVLDEAGLPADRVVMESDCEPLARELSRRIIPKPLVGDSSDSRRSGGVDEVRWLDEGDSVGYTAALPSAPTSANPLAPRARSNSETTGGNGSTAANSREHAIDLKIELYKQEQGSDREIWACALLAAAWQLYRLGAHDPDTNQRLVSPAAKSISVLSPRFLMIEAAVSRIISRIDLQADDLLRGLRDGRDAPTHRSLAARIGYLLPPV